MANTKQAGRLSSLPMYTDTGFDMRDIALAAAIKLRDGARKDTRQSRSVAYAG